jgi:uncharacterized membrane protein YoaK (UPF0700 family)
MRRRLCLLGLRALQLMAAQNAVQRVHFASLPPTTLMTGNTTQAVLDAVDLISGPERDDASVICARFGRMLRGIVWFAAGCAAAILYYCRPLVSDSPGSGWRDYRDFAS